MAFMFALNHRVKLWPPMKSPSEASGRIFSLRTIVIHHKDHGLASIDGAQVPETNDRSRRAPHGIQFTLEPKRTAIEICKRTVLPLLLALIPGTVVGLDQAQSGQSPTVAVLRASAILRDADSIAPTIFPNGVVDGASFRPTI